MSGEEEAPKNEFANFLDDIAEEITQRVESLKAPVRRPTGEHQAFNDERHILDWPGVADRMIDEMR